MILLVKSQDERRVRSIHEIHQSIALAHLFRVAQLSTFEKTLDQIAVGFTSKMYVNQLIS